MKTDRNITREVLVNTIKFIYSNNEESECYNKFLDDVENGGPCKRFSVFCTLNECSGNGDILILDNETYNFISWYKLTHIGRDLHTNIDNITDLADFIQMFYTLCREDSEQYG